MAWCLTSRFRFYFNLINLWLFIPFLIRLLIITVIWTDVSYSYSRITKKSINSYSIYDNRHKILINASNARYYAIIKYQNIFIIQFVIEFIVYIN